MPLEFEHLSIFAPPAWQIGGNAQTIFPALFTWAKTPPYSRSRWEWDDGDFVDVDTLPAKNAAAPILVLFHGLEGNSQSHYAKAIAQFFNAKGWALVLPHFRSCGGQPNRLLRAYHSGDADEIGRMLGIVRALYPSQALYAAGVSLGGNALLCYLARGENKLKLHAAASICAPLDLAACERALAQGFAKIYGRRFVSALKAKTFAKFAAMPQAAKDLDITALKAAKTLYEFDNAFTAPVHGYDTAANYYAQAASKPKLKNITTPTLLLNSLNDPFIPRAVFNELDLSASITPHFTAQGGHVGFARGALGQDLDFLPETLWRYFAAATAAASTCASPI